MPDSVRSDPVRPDPRQTGEPDLRRRASTVGMVSPHSAGRLKPGLQRRRRPPGAGVPPSGGIGIPGIARRGGRPGRVRAGIPASGGIGPPRTARAGPPGVTNRRSTDTSPEWTADRRQWMNVQVPHLPTALVPADNGSRRRPGEAERPAAPERPSRRRMCRPLEHATSGTSYDLLGGIGNDQRGSVMAVLDPKSPILSIPSREDPSGRWT